MTEEWKTYEYNGISYRVSNTGVIIGPRGRRIKERTNRDGYKEVTLGKTAHRSACVRVHRVVAELFVPNPENKPEVNHIDFDRTHNSSNNLEWVTHQENVNRSSSVGRYHTPLRVGEKNGRSKLTEDMVVKILALLKRNFPATTIAKMCGVGNSTIYNIKLGNTWTHISRE